MTPHLTHILLGFGTTMALITAIGAQNTFLLRQGILGRTLLPLIAFCTASDCVLYAVGISGGGFLLDRAPWAMVVLKIGGVAFLAGYGLMAAWRALRPSGEAMLVLPEEDAAPSTARHAVDAATPAAVDADRAEPAEVFATAGTAAPARGSHPAPSPSLSTAPAAVALQTAPRTPTDTLADALAGTAPAASASTLRGDRKRTGLGAALLTCAAMTWLNPHTYLDTVVLVGTVANQQGEHGRWWFWIGSCLGSLVWFLALGYAARLLRPLFARPGTWRVLDALIAVVMLFLAAHLALG